MKTKTHEYITITAEEGYFLTNHKGLYGTEIVLGANDSPDNYEELPLSEWPEELDIPETENESSEEQSELPTVEHDALSEAKFVKLLQIERYDVSEAVNGFYYNGQFMWLDRETRATLRNTIESFENVGREHLNIWYGDNYITLELQTAKRLLSLLEVYATDCYNITSMHKKEVSEMETIEEVNNFDITADYPVRLEFTTNIQNK